MVYPTKKEILADPRPTFKFGLLIEISIWKKNHYKGWGEQDPGIQWDALQSLANIITKIYGADPVVLNEWESIDHYDPVKKTISLKYNSILSLFHELGHHLFGPSELQACRWSVWLYQLRFRKDYENLIWQGHMLVRPNSKCATRRSASEGIPPGTTG